MATFNSHSNPTALNSLPVVSSLSTPDSSRSIIERKANEILKAGSGWLSLLSPVSASAQKKLAIRAEVVHVIHEAAAELVQKKAIADREVAEAESLALHDQARSLLLIRHREQHDELLEASRTDLVHGMKGLLEQKQTALGQLAGIEGDADVKALAAAAIASTFNTGVQHLANQHRVRQAGNGEFNS